MEEAANWKQREAEQKKMDTSTGGEDVIEEEFDFDSGEDESAEAYELWKIRELHRVLEMKKQRTERFEELERIERRRNMTEEERIEDDKLMDEQGPEKIDKQRFGFMQKYYHGGAFYQDKKISGEEPLYRRDINAPLASEQYDKELLPKAMQLRRGNFGVMGQTKYVSLKESDTTDYSSMWVDPETRARRLKWEQVEQDKKRRKIEENDERMKKMGLRI